MRDAHLSTIAVPFSGTAFCVRYDRIKTGPCQIEEGGSVVALNGLDGVPSIISLM
jgi:hypothetical protein